MTSGCVMPIDPIERLNRVLDDFALGRSRSGTEADGDIFEVVRRLAECRDAPAPDARFVERLATELQQGGALSGASAQYATTVPPDVSSRSEPQHVPAGLIRRLTPIIELAAVAALLLVFATGLFGLDALQSAFRGIWQGDATPVTVEGGAVPMLGVDPARRGMQPGPGPDGKPGLLWRRYVRQMMRPPSLTDGMLFVSAGGGVVAVDARTGDVAWTSRGLTNVVNSTPAVVDGIVYVGGTRSTETPSQGPDEGSIYALDAATGALLWESPTGGSAGSAPAVVDGIVYITGGKARVPTEYDHLIAFDAQTGVELWRYEIAGGVPYSPAVADGTVFVNDAGGRLHAVDAVTGQTRWVYQVPSALRPTSPVVADGLVLVGSAEDYPRGRLVGDLFAVEAATGDLSWRAPISAYSSPSVADGVIYAVGRGADGHTVHALDLATGRELWQTEIAEAGYSPVVADGTIYVGTWDGGFEWGTHGAIVALDADSGRVDWTVGVDGGVRGSVVVTGGVVYAGTTAGLLYAIGGTANAEALVTPAPDGAFRMHGQCTAPSVVDPLADLAGATPAPSVFDSIDATGRVPADRLPGGEPVEEHVIHEIEATIAALAPCQLADELSGLYGFYSVDFFLRLRAEIDGQLPPEDMVLAFGWRFSPFDDVRVVEAHRLADGRVGAAVEGSIELRAFVIFVRDGDRWLIDEVAQIAPAEIATPATDPATDE